MSIFVLVKISLSEFRLYREHIKPNACFYSSNTLLIFCMAVLNDLMLSHNENLGEIEIEPNYQFFESYRQNNGKSMESIIEK